MQKATITPAELVLRMDDGFDRHLRILAEDRILWEGAEYPAQLIEAAEALYLLTFDRADAPRENLTLVLDTASGLVTLVTCRQGVNPKRPAYIATDLLTGCILLPGKPENKRRHGFTDELRGKAIRWTYGGDFSIVHIYVTERYYRIRLLQRLGDADSPYERAMAKYVDRTEPAYYLRLRPGVVLFGFTEDNMDRVTPPEIACSSRAEIIDLNTMTAVGRGFGAPGGGVEVFRAAGEFTEPEPGELDPGSAYLV